MKTFETSTDATGLRVAVVVGRFNQLICAKLLEGAADELARRGASPDDVHVAWVPGAFEIPLAVRVLAASGRYDAVVALGVVIRGGTPHFDFVWQGVTDGVREVARDTGVPVAFGVLTTHTIDQAFERTAAGCNKGTEVAAAAVEMARLCQQLKGPPAGNQTPVGRPRSFP